MFQIQKDEKIEWPVTVNIPRDGGNITKATFTAHFKTIPQSQHDAIYRDGGNDEDLIRIVCLGWDKGVQDAAGKVLNFSSENLDMLLAIVYVRQAFINAYLECSNGKAAARKN